MPSRGSWGNPGYRGSLATTLPTSLYANKVQIIVFLFGDAPDSGKTRASPNNAYFINYDALLICQCFLIRKHLFTLPFSAPLVPEMLFFIVVTSVIETRKACLFKYVTCPNNRFSHCISSFGETPCGWPGLPQMHEALYGRPGLPPYSPYYSMHVFN